MEYVLQKVNFRNEDKFDGRNQGTYSIELIRLFRRPFPRP